MWTKIGEFNLNFQDHDTIEFECKIARNTDCVHKYLAKCIVLVVLCCIIIMQKNTPGYNPILNIINAELISSQTFHTGQITPHTGTLYMYAGPIITHILYAGPIQIPVFFPDRCCWAQSSAI